MENTVLVEHRLYIIPLGHTNFTFNYMDTDPKRNCVVISYFACVQ